MFKKYIINNTSGKKVLIFFILSNIIFAVMIFVTIPNVVYYADGMDIMDLLPLGYSPEYVQNLLNTIGEKGRANYLYYQLPVDMIYPMFFGISYFLLFGYLLKLKNLLNSNLFYICILPLMAGLADYAENICIIFLLMNHPDFSHILAQFANIFTISKSFISAIYFMSLVIFLLFFAYKSFKTIAKS